MHALLDHIDKQSGNVVTFWFRPERRIRFVAGQYIELYLPHAEADNRGLRRWFTISSSPNNEQIALSVDFPKKPSSFKQTLSELIPGSAVTLSDPLGDFVLPKDQSIPLLFVGAGTGCTPYASMVKWLIERNEKRNIQLLYAASNPDIFLFTDLWQTYTPLRMTRLVAHSSDSWHEHIGRLDVPFVLDKLSAEPESLIYLAGPQSLIEPLYDRLLKHVPRHQVLLDYFPGY